MVAAATVAVAAGLTACGGGDAAPSQRPAPPRAQAALRQLPAREARTAAVLVLLERGLHDGDVALLCDRVYDPADTASRDDCVKQLAGLRKGDPRLSIAPVRVTFGTDGGAVATATVTRTGGAAGGERQTFRLRRVPGAGWRVRLVL